MYELYNSQTFESRFHYANHDLGASWSAEKTVFRLWAPTADSVKVNLYQSGTPGTGDLIEQLPMTAGSNGTWLAEKQGNLNGIYYTYSVTVDGSTEEACDPYARTTGINGQRAMVLDLSSTNPDGWDKDADPNADKQVTDAVIWEVHVRDFSADESSGIRHKGKFLGLTETGTATPDGSPTGLDYLKTLGVTHIHLLPVFDYGFTDESLESPQYNWGYDPVNFNVPEGSYATDPCHGQVRVAEMKQMVKALHDAGLSVVMDVVYNHVYDGQDFCFNRIVPGYFSRINSEGLWSNGSICGNDTASERSMVRKYIVDSVNYWADEYHIDGFRFDLVGLIDVQTINEIVTSVHEKHPNVIFYGEGWDMPTELCKPNVDLAIQPNSHKLPGFAFFSDTIRDLMRGDIRDESPGFAAGAPTDRKDLDASFMGCPEWAAQPYQCINYVSCHDNHTLADRIALTTPEASREEHIRMNRLAAAFSVLSQGTPFFQAGEELLRTKPDGKGSFDENSYRSPDRVNAIRWSDQSKAEYKTNLNYYRGLLALRAAHPSLRLLYRDQVQNAIEPVSLNNTQAAAYRVRGEGEDLFLVFNASRDSLSVPLPQGRWELNIHDDRAGTEALDTLQGSVTVSPISAAVLTRAD